MNKKGAWPFFRKKAEPVQSKKEVIDLQADIAKNFSDLEAKLKASFNKGKDPIKNKDGNIIKFDIVNQLNNSESNWLVYY
jgi:hypothetical protein